jgi:F0F1-type ATP synthase membrane subunit b/b'
MRGSRTGLLALFSSRRWAKALGVVACVTGMTLSGPAHAEEHGHGHVPHLSDINWFTGLIGEKEGVEPGLLWRAPGTPVPLGALFINTAILFFLLGRFGGPAMSAGLKARKERLAGDIERASAMKEEAQQQLAEYEGRLSEMATEMARIKRDLREQAEMERGHVLAEAKARARDIAEDARQAVAQELADARQQAVERAVGSALELAQKDLIAQLNADDQGRLAHDLFAGLDRHLGEARS